MSDREKAIEILKEMPDNVSLKEIIEALSLKFKIEKRIDNFDISQATTTEELIEEIKRW